MVLEIRASIARSQRTGRQTSSHQALSTTWGWARPPARAWGMAQAGNRNLFDLSPQSRCHTATHCSRSPRSHRAAGDFRSLHMFCLLTTNSKNLPAAPASARVAPEMAWAWVRAQSNRNLSDLSPQSRCHTATRCSRSPRNQWALRGCRSLHKFYLSTTNSKSLVARGQAWA